MLLYSLKLGNLPEAMKCLKALIADVPYSNKKLASMDMEEEDAPQQSQGLISGPGPRGKKK